MSKQVGLDMKLYYNTGSFAAPTWAEISNCRDLTGPDSFAEADVSRRAAGFKQYEPTIRDFSIEWEMVKDDNDAGFTLVRTRYAAKTIIELALADGGITVSGTIFFRVECKLFKFERNESLEGANLYSVTAKPCWSANTPSVNTTP
jgi:hypothetical protein